MKRKEKQSLSLKEKPRHERRLIAKKLCEKETCEVWKKSCEREVEESSRLRELREIGD